MVAMAELLIFEDGTDPKGHRGDKRGRCAMLDTGQNLRLFQGNRQPGFKAYMQAKDLSIVMDTSRQYGLPLLSAGVHAQIFNAMLAMGMRELDNSAVIGVIESLANVKLLDP
jgi:2-hydroxy-3-oxopropionate reductase